MTAAALNPTAGLPLFEATKVLPVTWQQDRLAWCAAYLERNPQVFAAFTRLADQWRAGRPDRPTSADMICHALRFQLGVSADGDDWNINNNLTAVFARLYVLNHPDARFALRESWVDRLMPWELDRLKEAAHAGC